MTVREKMRVSNTNLEWCRPYIGKRVTFALCDGEIASLQIDGQAVEPADKTIPWSVKYTRDQIMEAATIATDGAADPDDPDALQALLAGDGKECACNECPWFDICAAMDEEV